MVSQEQQVKEQANEAKLNSASLEVMQIFIPAYAKLHPYFRMASQYGQGLIPHRICTSADGRTITVYNTNLGQVVGSYLTPTHEYITHAVSQGNIGQAIGAIFGGQGAAIKEQQGATCVTITPDEVLQKFPNPIVAPAPLIDQLNNLQRQQEIRNPGSAPFDNTSKLTTFIKNVPTPVLVIGTFGVSMVLIFTLANIFKS